MSEQRNVALWVIGEGGFKSQVLLAKPTGVVLEVVTQEQRMLEVIDLYVHPLRRGQGWASQLMGRACGYADRRRMAMALRVTGPRGYARPGLGYGQLKKFYNSFGFRTVPVRKPEALTYRIPLDSIMLRKAP